MTKNWPSYSNEEINSVKKVLKSGKVNYWTGTQCKRFEELYKRKFKLNYCISVANGTVALEAVLKSLNLKKNDEVIVTSKSYQSSASSIVNVGAKPIFCDVEFNSQNINIVDLKKKISKKTKAVVCVHIGGWPCDMKKIMQIGKINKIKIIEDCSQAHGAKINNRFVGSFGDMAVWSFCNDKIISTGGEGGMIALKNKKDWKKVWSYKEIGKNFDKVQKFSKKRSLGFNWVHDSFGTNLRMTEMQAVIGIIQLKKLDKTIKKRNKINSAIWKSLRGFKSVVVPSKPNNIQIAPYRCYVKINFDYIKSKLDLKNLIKIFNKKGLICNEGSCSEMYLEKSFKLRNISPKKRLLIASKLSKVSMAFFVNPLLNNREIGKKVKYIESLFSSVSIKK